MKRLLALAALAYWLQSPAFAYDDLYAGNGQYLGNTNRNRFDSDSVYNQFGNYGSRFSPTSINNQFSEYGGKFGQYSPYNQFSTQPPVAVPHDSLSNLGHVYQPYGLMNGSPSEATIPAPAYGIPSMGNTGMANYGMPSMGGIPAPNYGMQPLNSNNSNMTNYNGYPMNNQAQTGSSRGGLIGLGTRLYQHWKQTHP